jgi:hypothetical protein
MNKVTLQIQKAKDIISHDENLEKDYFEKVPVKWVNSLYKEKMLDIPESAYGVGSDQYYHHWIAGKYFLTRSATEYPKETLQILNEQITNKISNPVVISDLYDITLSLVGNISIDSLIKKMQLENWLEKVNIRNSASFTIEDIAKKLINNKEYKTLSMFLAYVLLFQNLKRGDYNNTETIIDDYDYQNILKAINTIEHKNINDLQMILDSLTYALNSYSEIEKGRKSNLQEKEYSDLSYIWINKVYEIDDELVITTPKALVQAISQLFEQNKSLLTESLLNSLNKYNFGVFNRIKLYGYSLISPDLVSNKLAILKEPLNDYHNLLEWEKTAKNLYPCLNASEKEDLLEHIHTLYKDYGVKEAIVRQGYVLSCLKEFLTPEDKKIFKDILEKSHPYRGTIISSGMKSGPNSPISTKELASKSIDEQIEFFVDSETKADSYQWERDLISPEGIARQWIIVIKEDPEKYINNLSKFSAEDLSLTYISHLLQALEESNADLTKTIDYVDSIINVYSSSNLHQYKGKADPFDVGTPSELLISILRFLEKAIEDKIPYKEDIRKKIFSLIGNLRAISSDESEDWINANGKEFFSHSLNSTSGLFMHVLYAYMIWIVKNDSNSGIPEEVVKLIKLQNYEYPENKTIRSVEGEYLTNFGDHPFFAELKTYLLPEDNKDLRYVAWETYLTRQVYLKIFEDFYDLYKLAIDEIGNIPDRKYWSNPEERLVEHIVIAYINGNKKAEELWDYLLKNKCYSSIAHAVNFIGRAFILREGIDKLGKEREEIILKIWKKLLNKNFRDTRIYEEIGWWIEKNIFTQEKILLDNLLETLYLSKGAIEPSHRVIKSLADFSKEFPLEVSNILLEMVNNRQPENIYFLEDKDVLDLINYLESTEIEECVLNMKKARQILVGKGFKQYKT